MCLAGTLLVPATLLILPQPAVAFRRVDDAKTYILERVFTKGASDRYNATFKAKSTNPQFSDLSVDLISRETTKEIKDGVATIAAAFDQAEILVGGLKHDIAQAFSTSKYKADKLGRIWDIKSEGGAPELKDAQTSIERPIAIVRSSFYPPKAVKVGDSWDVSVPDLDKKTKDDQETILAKGKSTVLGTEKLAGFDAIKIKTSLTLLLDPKTTKPVKFDGEALLDSITGKMLTLKGTLTGTFGPLGETKADISLSLMKEEPVKDVKDKKPEGKKNG